MDVEALGRATIYDAQQVRQGELLARMLLAHAVWDGRKLMVPLCDVLAALAPELWAERPLDAATFERPMTSHKADVLARRFLDGLALWNPFDADFEDGEGLLGDGDRGCLTQEPAGLPLVVQTHRGIVRAA